jgi:Tol biopolymer transport system component
MDRALRPERSAGILLLAFVTACAGASSPSSSPSVPSESASQDTTASPTSEPTPADETSAAGLALIRAIDGVTQVFVIDSDGTPRQVTGFGQHASFAAVRPFWSPDRTQIAFRPRAIGAGTDPQLWLVNADGSDQRPIADVGESISWSPDSTRLLFQDSVFTTDNTGEPPAMWVVEVSTGEVTMLGRGNGPAWAPDGLGISYFPIADVLPTDAQALVVQPLSGGALREIARAQGAWWSPDGTALLLAQDDGLHLAETDGSNARHLVDGFSPVWSPDGSRIVYTYDQTPEEALPIIGVVDRDGQVVWSGEIGGDPTWSPDGTKLAVEVGFPETSIHILNADSGQVIWELAGEDPAW